MKKDKKLSKNEKQLAKTWAVMKVKENKNFTTYFNGLYNNLSQRFNQELSLHTDFNDKVDFLQSLMDEITEALHNQKNNFQISELAERQIAPLNGLRNFFEKELNDIYFNPKTTKTNQNQINFHLKDAILKVINSNKSEHEITPKKGNNNAGRPKSKIEDIIEIIDKSWNIQGKKLFVEKLEKDFKDIHVKYNNGQKKNLNYLVLALIYLNILKSELGNKQYFESVGKKIIGVIPKGQSGFNAQLKKGENYVKNQAEYIDIENKLNKIVEHINNNYPNFELK